MGIQGVASWKAWLPDPRRSRSLPPKREKNVGCSNRHEKSRVLRAAIDPRRMMQEPRGVIEPYLAYNARAFVKRQLFTEKSCDRCHGRTSITGA